MVSMAPHRHSPDEDESQDPPCCLLSSLEAPLPAAMEEAGVEDALDLAELRLNLHEVGSEDGPSPEDDELTSLTWLQDRNLLKSIRVRATGEDVLSDSSPASSDYLDESSDCGANGMADGILLFHQPPNIPYNPKVHVNAKPPYSFSCLIFMAIEDAPGKALPVKDIYYWILTHFPYFQNAPTGWKNSVRHNLSLNKCFRKVDKDKGQNIGKGSLWCIDPDYRPNLLQALRKTPYHPYHQLQMLASQSTANTPLNQKPLPLATRLNVNIPNPELFPYLSKRLAASSIKDPEVDAAATMLALKNGPHVLSSYVNKTSFSRNGNGAILVREERRRKRLRSRIRSSSPGYHHKLQNYAPVITCSPSEDHTYSSTSSQQNVRSDSPTSSIDEAFEFSEPSNAEDLSDGIADVEESLNGTDSDISSFEDEEFDSAEEMEDWENELNHSNKVCRDPDDDEEQKKIVEGADALLNLAGIKTNLGPGKQTHHTTSRGRKKDSLSDLAQR